MMNNFEGSSPLTRGKPLEHTINELQARLIPAHAGKTPRPASRGAWAWAHPRSRGENLSSSLAMVSLDGSSPLTRGKPLALAGKNALQRLIPAHAGKTVSSTSVMRPIGAHPRSRGENPVENSPARMLGGSSPLTRGKPVIGAGLKYSPRLIPAHAGKTLGTRGRKSPWPAHPRSRGENDDEAREEGVCAGSSPLTRGKRRGCRWWCRFERLIPAHAGKTSCHPMSVVVPAAHPRSRGENFRSFSFGLSGDGSSPLTRGKRRPLHLRQQRLRLIPAHAGKTDCFAPALVADGAHPRSRGENPPTRSTQRLTGGSSPLTRGKRVLQDTDRIPERLIPAHAGKTLPDLRFYCADRSDLGNP